MIERRCMGCTNVILGIQHHSSLVQSPADGLLCGGCHLEEETAIDHAGSNYVPELTAIYHHHHASRRSA